MACNHLLIIYPFKLLPVSKFFNHWLTIDLIKVLVNSLSQFLFAVDTNSPKHLFGHLTIVISKL